FDAVLLTRAVRLHFGCLSTSCTLLLFFSSLGVLRHLHSFPTRRSSDLATSTARRVLPLPPGPANVTKRVLLSHPTSSTRLVTLADRKSTRLNSSHQIISYAVFCLKKKKNTAEHRKRPTHR